MLVHYFLKDKPEDELTLTFLTADGEEVRSFKGKRASTVKPVLDALAGLGMARRLNDGRYAA